MHPHPEGQSDFNYPLGGLLQVKGVVKEAELRSPKQLDANGEECLLVVKNGKTTGVTIGRVTGIESVIREYGEYGLKRTSREVAVYPYSHKDGAFSAPGDSGSIVVDGEGRLVGLLTGGSGTTESTDVTYIMPYFAASVYNDIGEAGEASSSFSSCIFVCAYATSSHSVTLFAFHYTLSISSLSVSRWWIAV